MGLHTTSDKTISPDTDVEIVFILSNKELEAISLEQTDGFDLSNDALLLDVHLLLAKYSDQSLERKSKRKSYWTIEIDIQTPDSLAVKTKASPSYIT